MGLRVNIGCGQSPTRGWRNYDNSKSLWFTKIPLLPKLLHNIGYLNSSQYTFIQFARDNAIEYGDATKGLPIKSNAVDVLYTSHMLEHLDRNEATRFLKEAFRILNIGGIIRIAVPDLKKIVDQYIQSGDADAFIISTYLCVQRPRTFRQRLTHLLVGTRHHQWMYDGNSLSNLLQKNGFVNAVILPPGQTQIQDPQTLDLNERFGESVYVEATKPKT